MQEAKTYQACIVVRLLFVQSLRRMERAGLYDP